MLPRYHLSSNTRPRHRGGSAVLALMPLAAATGDAYVQPFGITAWGRVRLAGWLPRSHLLRLARSRLPRLLLPLIAFDCRYEKA